MEIKKAQGKKAVVFESFGLDNVKYDMLADQADFLLEKRNEVSRIISENLYDFLKMGKYDFCHLMKERFGDQISPLFDDMVYGNVLTCYQNKFDTITKNLRFRKLTYKRCETYKRDCKGGKKGEYKRTVNEEDSTPLSVCMTYLVRYGGPDTPEFISVQLEGEELSDSKRKFYEEMLGYFEKFTFERLYILAMSKRDRIIRHYNRKPIEFKSRSFNARSRKIVLFGENKNKDSVIRCFANLSWPGCDGLCIPLKWSDDYHGKLENYLKKTNDYRYNLSFSKRRREVRIAFVVDCEDDVVYITDADKAVGIDVNLKHNLMSFSDGAEYDFDRELLNEFISHQKRTDELKKQDKDYQVGKKHSRVEAAMRLQMRGEIESLVAKVCKDYQAKGVSHFVMEDLKPFSSTKVKPEEFCGVNLNRVIRFIGISDLKNTVKRIATNYGIAVSFVPSHYTSKMCPKCGTIADENRLTQESFCCVKCGHSDNADHNAAVNIRNRVSGAVRLKLLKQNEDGTYVPKKNLKKETIKKALCSVNGVHGKKAQSSPPPTDLS